ncbi:class I SAM-dependent methyltransferase [Inhella gelatinilytica]|uniref:SAM-dependent methyltransferase n=1 Tax=Inhella gelatinilytica TaxID=2795030 RepID=A0A931NB67_9BURK|nr:SAM-dependent methyltransferase [Inhella gelatinilytica]MBH9553248.1 SAM-dependent methyltransferase [Inhella gelatinilytica]
MSESDPAQARFLVLCAEALVSGAGFQLQLSHPSAAAGDLERIRLRPVRLQGGERIQVVWRHRTRDLTQNLLPGEVPSLLAQCVGSQMRSATLLMPQAHWQLDFNRKGRGRLSQHPLRAVAAPAGPDTQAQAHNRAKPRWLDLQQPAWHALGVAQAGRDSVAQLVPAMARKWRQINHFVELFDAALRTSGIPPGARVRVADFGCGKAYLTFAVHEHLLKQGWVPDVRGVELRSDLVEETEAIARRLGLTGLHFHQGDVGHAKVEPLDVMIALHACDTATDHALHHGLRAQARIILTAPCCHKQLRGQLQPPGVLKPLFKHGVHLGQEAEMLTDGLRALLLEAQGFDTQVIEFVSLEHTAKNKMIQAVRRPQANATAQALAQEQATELMAFWGVREQALKALLERTT